MAAVAENLLTTPGVPTMSQLRRIAHLLNAAFAGFNAHDGWLIAGGISYYVAISLFPLLLVLVAAVGWAFQWTDFGQDAKQAILTAVEHQVSADLSEQLGRAFDSVSAQASASGGAVGFVLLVVAAIAIFAQFDHALDRIWEVKPRRKASWLRWLVGWLFSRLRALVMLAAAAAFIILVMVASFTWTRLLPSVAPTAVNIVLNLLAFAVVYRFVPQSSVRWSEAIRGGVVAAVLWEIGRVVLAWYVTRRGLPTAYGIIGSFLAVMLWAYYATIVVFIGAEYVRALQGESPACGDNAAAGPGPTAPAAEPASNRD